MVAVIVAVPAETPVTTPVDEFTVATPVAPDDHVIVFVVASAGLALADSVIVEPMSTDEEPEMEEMPVTATFA